MKIINTRTFMDGLAVEQTIDSLLFQPPSIYTYAIVGSHLLLYSRYKILILPALHTYIYTHKEMTVLVTKCHLYQPSSGLFAS